MTGAVRARLAAAPVVPTWTAAAHLAALSAFAVARPIFDILNAGTLTEWYFRPLDVVVAGVALTVLPPAVMLAAELAVGLVSRPARHWLHLAFVAGLAAVIAVLAMLLRWRRSGAAGLAGPAPRALDAVEARRLEAELDRLR